jgi:CRISPR/Cas system-associated exonuclease Cas4 (RecB family)
MADLNPKYYEYQTWSYSRHGAFKECRRQYWFEYVSTYDSNQPRELVTRIWALRKLTSTKFLMGSLVHGSVEEYLTQLGKGRALSEGELQDHFLQNVDRIRRSDSGSLAESVNGKPPDPEYFDRISTEGAGQLAMFLRVLWPPLSRNERLSHEKLERIQIGKARVGLKVDLVTRASDGRIFVTDWKTGGDDPRYESRLQLGVYALWAAERFQVPLTQVVTDLAYLKTGKTSGHTLPPEEVERVRETIQTEFATQMTETDRGQNIANPSPARCLSCKYATVCESADLSLVHGR